MSGGMIECCLSHTTRDTLSRLIFCRWAVMGFEELVLFSGERCYAVVDQGDGGSLYDQVEFRELSPAELE